MRNLPLTDKMKLAIGLLSTVPSTSTPVRVSMKAAERVTVYILVKNATTVTGSAITLKQSTDAAGTGEKALSFSTAYRNIDTAAANGDILAAFAVTSDTFTTNSTNSKNLMYAIEVKAADLDVTNGFCYIRAGTGDATAATVTVLYAIQTQENPGALSRTVLT